MPFDLAALASLDAYKRGTSRAGIAAILDELREISGDGRTSPDETAAAATSPLAGKIDLSRLAIGGHSSGGRTALDVAAFAEPAGVSAVFTYGASLVNSGAGDFAERGSVVPSETPSSSSTQPPPRLLLLGGSEDGISAGLSATGDATETLRRTMTEGLLPNPRSIAELAILKGANHMVFCDPIDPTCGAAKVDRPLTAGVDGETIRDALGSLIVDFLASSGVVSSSSPLSAMASEAAAAASSRSASTLATSLFHLTDAIRVPSGERSAPEVAAAAATAATATAAAATDDDDDGMAGAWSQLSGALDGWLERLSEELRMEPSSFAADCAEWSAGDLTGSLQGYTSPAVAWGVRYANEAPGGAKSVGVNIWLRSVLPVPHLTLYVGVRGGRATLMADHLPRFDMGKHPEHVAAFYSDPDAQQQWSAAQKAAGVVAFRSADPAVRALQGPNALALTGAASDASIVQTLRAELDRHVSTWLQWVHTTPLLPLFEEAESYAGSSTSSSSARSTVTTTTTAVNAAAVEARDVALRVALREHERAAGERFMGVDVAKRLSAAMAGPHTLMSGSGDGERSSSSARDGKWRPEPLAWRPPRPPGGGGGDGSSSCSLDVDAELRRFGVAAQRVVAGLPAEVTEGAEANEGGSATLRVEVTVHRDLGSFMASKPSLAIKEGGGGAVLVQAHAFLEPEWSAFERPLANAPNGVYTYHHEAPEDVAADADAEEQLRGLLTPTLCLKMKRREAVTQALLRSSTGRDDGSSAEDAMDDQPADKQAARRVNELACHWRLSEDVVEPSTAISDAAAPSSRRVRLELTDDYELLDDPNGPFGNKGGLYIESRIRAAHTDGNADVVRVTSPTISTPLSGVPEPFLAGHYMKVLCPLAAGGHDGTGLRARVEVIN